MAVQAAALSIAGNNFVVALVTQELVGNHGEADMAIDTLEGGFGVPVVLVAQLDDGTPRYYGDRELVGLLKGVPLEQMPFKEYPVG